MQNKKNSKIISKLVLSTTAAFMATVAVKATNDHGDVQSQVESFHEDQLQVAYGKGDSITVNVTLNGVKYSEGDSSTEATVTGCENSNIPADGYVKIDKTVGTSVSYNVTSIADEAFKDCSNLVSVEIPESVKKIGQDVFDDSGVKYIKFTKAANLTESGDLGSATIYVEDDDGKSKLCEVLGLDTDDNKVIIAPKTSDIKGNISSVGTTIVDNGVELKWKISTGAKDLYAVERKENNNTSNYKVIGIAYPKTSSSTSVTYTDTDKIKLGKSYMYKITPYAVSAAHDQFNTKDEFTSAKDKDPFGIVAGTDKQSGELDYNEFKKSGVKSYYTTVDIENDTDSTTVEGSYAIFDNGLTRNVYSLQGNAYGIKKSDNNTKFEWENDDYDTNQKAFLYVREWDIENKDKTNWENVGAENKNASRVFSLQVVNDKDENGELPSGDYASSGDVGYYNCASKIVSADSNKTPKDFTMYVEMDESWGNDVSVYAIRDDDTDVKLTSKIVDGANGLTGRFLEVALGEFYYGPYAIYADKLENAGTSNSEFCETCQNPIDECTCEKKNEEAKDEPKDETKTEDDKNNNNNASETNSTQTGNNVSSGTSNSYKTGDITSAGLLQSAFGMLAAAGSTLIGLFRKKKDQE